MNNFGPLIVIDMITFTYFRVKTLKIFFIKSQKIVLCEKSSTRPCPSKIVSFLKTPEGLTQQTYLRRRKKARSNAFVAVASCDDVRTLMYGGSNSVMTPNVWTFWPLSYQGCFVVVLTSAVRKKNALLGGLDFAQ